MNTLPLPTLKTSIFSLGALLFSLTAPAWAKTLYVNGSTGNDSTSYAANGPSAPWRTIGRAAWGSSNRDVRNGTEAARAGDIVLVAAGTYSGTATQSRNEILYYNENNGTAGNPLIFRANGTVILTQTGRGPLIGSYQRNYVTWDGFTIDENNALSYPDVGPVSIAGCTGCVIQNIQLTGNGTDFSRPDNHPGIRIEQSQLITVRNNRVHNFYNGNLPGINPNNGACIQIYAADGILIENNELYDCGSGVFFKGGPWSGMATNASTVRYNYIHDIGEVRNGSPDGHAVIAYAGAPYTAQNPLRIYQNILRNGSSAAFVLWPGSQSDPTGGPQHVKFVNNTADNFRNGIWVQSSLIVDFGNMFWNNIVTNVSAEEIAYTEHNNLITKNHFDIDHNVYFGFQSFASTLDGRYTLAQWRSSFNQDAASPVTQNVNPLYQDGTNGNYHLQSNSPALIQGVDVLDLNGNGSTADSIPAGAYITGNEVIGLNTGGITPPPPPPPPSNACDLDGNGVTVTDVQVCVNQALGITACTSADIDQDNRCNVVDVQRVVNAALGGPCLTP